MHTQNYNELNDLELVAYYKRTNDNTYVGVLFKRYTHLIFGVCMNYLKNEEESQDTCMSIFEKLLVDLKKHEITHFKAWLYMLSKNYCLMQLRTKSGKLKKEKEYTSFMESEQQLHLTAENTKEIQLTKMEECMEVLNVEQKQCIELFYLKELSYQEVADQTNYSMNNVKSFIQNGKRNLKNCMESKIFTH